MELVIHNPAWSEVFAKEVILIESVFDADELLDIQHVGSTSIASIKAKPIIDIAVLVTPDEFIQGYVRPLSKIGYEFFPESSSTERLFFRKGTPVQFHLSLTQEGLTPYFDRQIIFRDYLNDHVEAAKEYEKLKESLLAEFPDAGQKYADSKTEFIMKILQQAEH